MHCTNCGAAVAASANFCTACGSRVLRPSGVTRVGGDEPSGIGALCAGLVSELDSARDGWASLVNDVMSSSEGGVPFVNREFSENIYVGPLGDDEPATFVFDRLNGVSAESTVIAWQIQSALGFATSQEYIGADDGQEWLMVLTKALSPTSNPRWILAMQMVLSSFQKGVMIDEEDMATVLAHFFMNEGRETPGVRRCREKLPGLITFLQGFTYIGTARAFGDPETVARIQKTLGF